MVSWYSAMRNTRVSRSWLRKNTPRRLLNTPRSNPGHAAVMKLTLQIFCDTYDHALRMHRALHERGYDSFVSSPSNYVLITARPEALNHGKTMFEELESALVFVGRYFLTE